MERHQSLELGHSLVGRGVINATRTGSIIAQRDTARQHLSNLTAPHDWGRSWLGEGVPHFCGLTAKVLLPWSPLQLQQQQTNNWNHN